MKHILYWLIAGTRGGGTRARIIETLKEKPSNAHQLAESIGMDYRTIRHHLKVLADNEIIMSAGEKYGKIYFLSRDIEEKYDTFEDIWKKKQEADK